MNWKDKLKEFAHDYACDGIEDLEVIESAQDYAILRVQAWNGSIFRLKVVDFREEGGE